MRQKCLNQLNFPSRIGSNALREVSKRQISASVRWAFRLLEISLVILLAGAGADKIFQASLSWNEYLPPVIPWLFGTDVPTFLAAMGSLEILLALGIVISPALFGALVSLWLLLASLLLIGSGSFHDLSLQDLALAMAAFGLASLGQVRGIAALHRPKPRRFRLVVPSYLQSHAAR